jgi:hypothetical protein
MPGSCLWTLMAESRPYLVTNHIGIGRSEWRTGEGEFRQGSHQTPSRADVAA